MLTRPLPVAPLLLPAVMASVAPARLLPAAFSFVCSATTLFTPLPLPMVTEALSPALMLAVAVDVAAV